MPRYATIIIDDDGHQVVSAIGEFEGAAPHAHPGRVELVAPGVLIGMVRDAGGGFCFPPAGIGKLAAGLVTARLKARAAAPKPASAARPKRARGSRKKSARSRKPARSMPKAGRAAFAGDIAAEPKDRADG